MNSFFFLNTSSEIYYMPSYIHMEDKHFHYSVEKIRYAYPKMILSYLQFKFIQRRWEPRRGQGLGRKKELPNLIHF